MRIGSLSVLLIALLLPVAAAQVPSTEVATTLEIADLPMQVQGLENNATVTVPFTVNYRANGNFLCPQPAAVPITITLSQGATSSFLTATLDTAEGSVAIGAGPHQGASGSVSGSLTIVLTEITANASIPLTLTADAGAVQGCTPGLPAAQATATTYANMTFVPPPPPPPPEIDESPGFELVFLAVAGVAAAVMMRRKRV